ncbi:MAG: substrate-binding domain-containing protein [Campylobacterales bacterium]|nr:substrate-binding domain-containing protein [Campylobacterales bacterium]
MWKIRSILLFFFLSLTLCFGKTQNQKIVAFAQDTMANDFRKAQVYEVRDALLPYAYIKFVYSDAEGRTSLLIKQIEKFIDQKVDLLIIGTNDADAVVPVVSKAYKNGIPVIILDRGINGDDYTTFINSDNMKIGRLGAQYIAKELQGKGRVLLFEGLPKADVTKLRSQGFLEELKKYKQIKVIKRTGNYLRRDAIIEMEKLIKEGIKVDAIFSESDSMLSGVRSALKHYNIDPSSIIMVGCDYTSEAQKAIIEGSQSGSVLFPLAGKQAAQTAIAILNKQSVSKRIVIPVQLITSDLAREVPPVF